MVWNDFISLLHEVSCYTVLLISLSLSIMLIEVEPLLIPRPFLLSLMERYIRNCSTSSGIESERTFKGTGNFASSGLKVKEVTAGSSKS